MYELDIAKKRKEFIAQTESGVYTGINVDGEKVVVIVQQGQGCLEIKTHHKEKPKWYEVRSYDEEGYQESLSYESYL